MEAKDWITILSALIIAMGWFVTGYLNRTKDIAQKRLEYRLKMLESFLPVFFAILNDAKKATSSPEVMAQLIDARYKFALYGFNDEQNLMTQLFEANNNKDGEEPAKKLNALFSLVQKRIRDELKIAS